VLSDQGIATFDNVQYKATGYQSASTQMVISARYLKVGSATQLQTEGEGGGKMLIA
jgi:hypothetical protein